MEIKAFIKKWQPEAKDFFSTFPWKNVLVFLFFPVIGFHFLVDALFQKENVESTYRIPLKYTSIPDDVVFDNPLPSFLEVSVADNGGQIFLLDLRKRDSLEINVAEITEGGNSMLQGDQYRQLIRGQLFPSTTIRGYYPMNISLATSKLQSKELPVIFDGEITTNRANLVADSATFIPETVMAYGSQQSLSELKGAVTEYTVFKNLKATSQLPVKINNVEGIKFIPSQVEIYIPVEEYTERTFEIPITAVHLPKTRREVFPSRANVTFSVTLEEYKKIVPEDFSIQLDYRDFHSNEDGRVELELTVSPASVVNPRVSPASVEFLFESKAD